MTDVQDIGVTIIVVAFLATVVCIVTVDRYFTYKERIAKTTKRE